MLGYFLYETPAKGHDFIGLRFNASNHVTGGALKMQDWKMTD